MGRPRQATALLEAKGAFDKNPNRRRSGEPVPPEGELEKPKFLKGKASKIWDAYAPICFGMGTARHGDEAELGTWCVLQAEFESGPDKMQTSRIAQKRAYAEKFGIAGAGARAKLGTDGGEDKDKADDYFTIAGQRPGSTVCQ